ADQLDHDLVPLEAEGAGHDLGDEVRVLAGGGEHAVGLGGAEAQPGLGQDVLAGGQGGEQDRAVQVGPGADEDGVDVGVGDDLLPVGVGARDVVLAGDGGGGLGPAVADGDEVDVRQGEQAGDVPRARVGAGADQADAEGGVGHGVLTAKRPGVAAAGGGRRAG